MGVIYSYPYDDDGNDYIVQCHKIWQGLGHDIRPFTLKFITDDVKRRDRIVILNWIEDWILASSRPKIVAFGILLVYLFVARTGAARLIWVRHNILPNVTNRAPAYRRMAVAILSRIADSVVVHRPLPLPSTVYVPHPLYIDEPGEAQTETERDIEYLVFGHFRPSKSVDRLLEYWPASRPLALVGKAKSPAFATSLRTMMAARGMTVTWDDRLLPVAELAAYLRRARFVVIVNNWESVIVSGAFYHAISFGANVLISDGAFPRFAAEKLPFVNLFSDEADIEDAIAKARAISPTEVVSQALSVNGPDVCARHWGRALKG